jgi:hypothetical protein
MKPILCDLFPLRISRLGVYSALNFIEHYIPLISVVAK